MARRPRSRQARLVRALVALGCAIPLIPSVSAQASTHLPSIQLSRSSIVIFDVRHKELLLNGEQFGGYPDHSFELGEPMPERYAALYFPAAGAGWVQVRDPDAPKNPPLVAPLGNVHQSGFTFKPHHQYSMIVALDKPGRLVFPDGNFHVVGFRHRQIVGATLNIHPLPVPGGSSAAVAGFTENPIVSAQASMVALSVDYEHASSRIISGDACAAPVPGYACTLDRTGYFQANWWGTDSYGQDTVGRSYASAPTGSYITGEFEVLEGAQFQAARLIAFGLRYNQ